MTTRLKTKVTPTLVVYEQDGHWTRSLRRHSPQDVAVVREIDFTKWHADTRLDSCPSLDRLGGLLVVVHSDWQCDDWQALFALRRRFPNQLLVTVVDGDDALGMVWSLTAGAQLVVHDFGQLLRVVRVIERFFGGSTGHDLSGTS